MRASVALASLQFAYNPVASYDPDPAYWWSLLHSAIQLGPGAVLAWLSVSYGELAPPPNTSAGVSSWGWMQKDLSDLDRYRGCFT